jgi:hypothetical protein
VRGVTFAPNLSESQGRTLMTQLKELPPAVFGWRSLAVSAVVVVVA